MLALAAAAFAGLFSLWVVVPNYLRRRAARRKADPAAMRDEEHASMATD